MNALVAVPSFANKVIFFSSFPASGQDEVMARLLRLVLQNDYVRPTQDIMDRSTDLLNTLKEAGFEEFEIFSGNDGEVLISSFRQTLCFEVTIEPDGVYSVNVEIAGVRVLFDEQVGPAKVLERLNDAMRLQWISSGGFVPVGGATGNSAGRVLRSRNLRAKTAGPASLNIPVLSAQVAT